MGFEVTIEFHGGRRQQYADVSDVEISADGNSLVVRRGELQLAVLDLTDIRVWWRSDHYAPRLSRVRSSKGAESRAVRRRYRSAFGICVSDVMTREPVCIGEEEALEEAEGLFETYDFNALPVVDEEWRVLGIITKLDVLKALLDPGQRPDDVIKRPVREHMTSRFVSVAPESELSAAARLIVETGHKSLPVLGSGVLEGMVAREDVLRGVRLSIEESSMGA